MKIMKPRFVFLVGIMVSMILVINSCSFQVKDPEPIGPVPTSQQLAWHELELYAFIHFTTNTFTDVEWGFGNEDPSVFNPTELDAEQWAKVLKDAGFKGIILTCKHHDGFCLWPSKYTEHSVKNSPYKNGKGDVVKEVREACEKYDLKFGIYLSPWDRNRADYGQPEYIEYYRNQLVELFNEHAPIFEMWFDGANGGDGYYGGANETRRIDKKVYYDWPKTLSMVREIDSNVLFFSDAGPDIRWCGNEEGHIQETNWNTITTDTLYAGKRGINDLLNTGSEDGKSWVPAEVNTSIRPGWFYHKSEDDSVKTPEELLKIYMESVGRGSNLHLNVPPDKRGLINEHDIASLMGWKKLIDERFEYNLASFAHITASNIRGNSKKFKPTMITDEDKDTYWATDDDITSASLEIKLNKEALVKYVLIQEYIKLGQRVKAYSVEAFVDEKWVKVGESTTIGYKKILPVEQVTTSKIRVNFLESKGPLVISNIEVY